MAHALGEVTWLLTQSPIHKQMFLADLEWFAMPPLLLEQFRVFYGPAQVPGGPPMPAAVAFWAMVTEETETRLAAGAHKLAPHEWRAGDRPWLIELIAPFGAQDEILRDLAANIFKGREFKFHMTGADGKRRVVSSTELNPKPN
ncbi:MAG: toxin-activating lysine-acyltransferase [Hyphomonadaceae bacterium]